MSEGNGVIFGALMSTENLKKKVPKDPLFSTTKNSWRVLHQVPHVSKCGFDFARRCGEVMMPQNQKFPYLWHHNFSGFVAS